MLFLVLEYVGAIVMMLVVCVGYMLGIYLLLQDAESQAKEGNE
jgi:hypothetical protein